MPDTDPYLLLPEELGAFRAMLIFEQHFGPKTPDNLADYGNYLNNVYQLSCWAAELRNATLKGLLEKYYTGFLGAGDLAKLFVAHNYQNFTASSHDPSDQGDWYPDFSDKWVGFWHCFVYGWRWRDTGDFDNIEGRCFPQIPFPKSWTDANAKLRTDWADNPSSEFIDKGVNKSYIDVHGFQISVFRKKWPEVLKNLKDNQTLWSEQKILAGTLKTADKLTGTGYLFLLHFLLAMCTQDDTDAQAKKWLLKTASTEESPNDSFLNHLTYAVLLFLANPAGTYKYDNYRLKLFVRDLKAAIVGTGEVQTKLAAALDVKANLLEVDSQYPYPADDYTNRLNDVLKALDGMRKSI